MITFHNTVHLLHKYIIHVFVLLNKLFKCLSVSAQMKSYRQQKQAHLFIL